MTRHRLITMLSTLLFLSHLVHGQSPNGIEIPNLNDKYSEFVKKLESGNTDIDYREFRYSFLESKQYQIKLEKGAIYDSLKMQMFAQAKRSNYQEVIKLTKAMLSIDYTSLYAHKYLQQTYKILGDTTNRNKYHDIEFGLIYSITNSGNSQTCETSWEVVQIEEEYFTLNMIGVEFQKQSIDNGKTKVCDKMQVKTEDGKIEFYYFDVTKLLTKFAKK